MDRKLGLVALLAAAAAGACASAGAGNACPVLRDQCRADCDAAFETNPSAWDYQSCLKSCEPDPGAICEE